MKKNQNQFNEMLNELESMFNELESLFGKSFIGPTINSKTETGEDENGVWTKQTFSSEDGSYNMSYVYRTQPKKKVSKIKELKSQLEDCVESQNFEKAVEIRDQIKALEESKEKINLLQKELEKCVKDQNFERAIEIRDQLKRADITVK